MGVSYGDAVFDKDDWYGAAVNLAARLCAAAETGHVLASADAVAAASVDNEPWQPLEPMTLKGFPEPVAVLTKRVECSLVPHWPLPVELDVDGSPPLVGRQALLDAMQQAWRRAASGESSVLSLAGAAGAGTSRLLAEFAESVAGNAVVVHCSAHSEGGVTEQLIRSYAVVASSEQLREDAGPDGIELAALCPLVGLRLAVSPSSVMVDAGEDAFWVAESCCCP